MQARNSPFICEHCGYVIGVYEPLIVRADGAVRETSRVSEPGLSPPEGETYHRGCYVAQLKEPGIGDDV